MKAAWYEKPGPAREVLIVGEMDEPQPQAGEVRIRVAATGVNPGDVKIAQAHEFVEHPAKPGRVIVITRHSGPPL